GYYLPGKEPGFQTPFLFLYHFGKPAELVVQVRRIVQEHFNSSRNEALGCDNDAVKARLLTSFLLELYPVVASGDMPVSSPFMPGYVTESKVMGVAKVTVKGFDPDCLARDVPVRERAHLERGELPCWL
ncbi:uncharacterized protein BDZ83DRAFT_766769, partial [Colletotrichum acutatum]